MAKGTCYVICKNKYEETCDSSFVINCTISSNSLRTVLYLWAIYHIAFNHNHSHLIDSCIIQFVLPIPKRLHALKIHDLIDGTFVASAIHK